jgi:hypothetical protein
MRFMMFVKHPEDYDMSQVPPALFGPMGEFVMENMKSGKVIDGAGLKPLAKGTRVRIDGGKIKVTDGPFSEAKEVVGGYGHSPYLLAGLQGLLRAPAARRHGRTAASVTDRQGASLNE